MLANMYDIDFACAIWSERFSFKSASRSVAHGRNFKPTRPDRNPKHLLCCHPLCCQRPGEKKGQSALVCHSSPLFAWSVHRHCRTAMERAEGAPAAATLDAPSASPSSPSAAESAGWIMPAASGGPSFPSFFSLVTKSGLSVVRSGDFDAPLCTAWRASRSRVRRTWQPDASWSRRRRSCIVGR
jgi:hypothetical protein